MPNAGHVGNPISHTKSMKGLIGGLIVGAVVGAAIAVAVVATGGAALIAVAAVGASVAAGGGIGQVLGSMSWAGVDITGALLTGSFNVFVNGKLAAHAHLSTGGCSQHGPSPQLLAQGSDSVFVNGLPFGRVGDLFTCSGKLEQGSADVFVGGGTATTDEISPEIPAWVNWTLGAVGLASAVILAGPIVAVLGTVGGMTGGEIGGWLGRHVGGSDSDAEKWGMLIGGLAGGFAGTKGGMRIAQVKFRNATTPWQAWNRNGMVFARTLDYKASSGVVLRGTPGKTTTILGNFGKDMNNVVAETGNIKTQNFGARPGDFQILNVADDLYVTPKQFWAEYNEPWLAAAVKRGDGILMATEPNFGPNSVLFRVNNKTGKYELSGFGKEYFYLRQNGYKYDPATMKMVSP